MVSVISLKRGRGGNVRLISGSGYVGTVRVPGRLKGVFAIEVDDIEVWQLLEAVEISTAPYSLADWMRMNASPLVATSIVERFGDNGGSGIYGAWAPLADSTVRIKEALGVSDPEAPNDRTQDMLASMLTDHLVMESPLGATMVIPGDLSDDVLRQKLLVAAKGWTQGPGSLFPGAVTPPRPVAVLDAADAMMLLVSLQFHIMETIDLLVGSHGGGGGVPGSGQLALGPGGP